MRAYEIITERFHDTGWLLDSIYDTVKRVKFNSNNFDPITYYTVILNNILDRPEFKSISDGISVRPNIIIDNTSVEYVLGGSLKVETFKNMLDYMRWNEKTYYIQFNLIVTSIPPVNTVVLISDLDSVVGHELEHLVQRLHRLKDNHYTTGNMKKVYSKYILGRDSVIDYENTINYVNVKTPIETEIKYYLRHGELLSHAQSIGSYLYNYYGPKSISILPSLYKLGWQNRLNNTTVPNKVRILLIKYSRILKYSEIQGLLSNGLKLYKKLFKEIYRVLNNCVSAELIH